MQVTKNVKGYIKPSYFEVKNKAREYKLDSVNDDLVTDLLNAAANKLNGNKIQDVLDHNLTAESYINENFWFHKDQQEEKKKRIEETKTLIKNKQKFLRELDLDKFPGKTPLEKALNVEAMLQQQQKGKGGGSSKGGSTEQLFSEDGQALSDKLHEKMELFKDINPEGEHGFEGSNVMSGIKPSDLTEDDWEFLEKLSLLNDTDELKVGTSTTEVEDPRGTIRKIDQMTSYSQINKVLVTEYGKPNFAYKFAKKQLMRIKKVTKTIKRQTLVFLLDDSGSMSDRFKLQWVKAALFNRLQAVLDNKAVLYINTFEVNLDERWLIIDTPEKAKELLEKIRKTPKSIFGFNRGGTDVEKAVNTASSQFDRKNLTIKGKQVPIEYETKPQILVVNDGQDRVDSTKSPLYMTHGLTIGRDNKGFKKYVENSGGLYKTIEYS